MSAYPPPNENLSIFDSSNFHRNTEDPETIAILSQYFLKYPQSQGSETINGSLTATNQITANTNIVMNGTPGTNYIQFPDNSKQYVAGGPTPTLSAVLTAGSTATNSITLNNSGTGSNVISLLPNAGATDPQITLTDGTTTNTINKNGYTTRNTTTNATHYLNFSDSSATGTGAIQKTGGISCNPSTNTITATNFAGNLSGTITITDDSTTDAYFPLVFVSTFATGTSPQSLKADIGSGSTGNLTWNPVQNILRLAQIVGNQSGTYGMTLTTQNPTTQPVAIPYGVAVTNGAVTFANGNTLSAGIKYTTYANGAATTYTLPITALNSLTSVTSSNAVTITLPSVVATAPINYTQVPIYVQNASGFNITLTTSTGNYAGLYGTGTTTTIIPQGGTIGVYWDTALGTPAWNIFSITGYNQYLSATQSITATTTLSSPVKSIYFINTISAITISLPDPTTTTGILMTFRRGTAAGPTNIITFNSAAGGSVMVGYASTTLAASFTLGNYFFTTTIQSNGTNYYQLQTI